MANYTTKLKTWGAQGQEYPTNYSYIQNEAPVDAWDNFTQYNLIEDVKSHLIPLTNARIESDTGIAGGEPASPEISHLYHDTDNEILEIWDSTDQKWKSILKSGNALDTSLNFDGLSADNVGAITGPTGTVVWDGTEIKSSIVQSNGLDADLLDGNHASDLGSGVSDSGTQIVNTATDFNFGSNLFVSDDGNGAVTIEAADGSDTHTAISEGGTQTLASVDDINLTGHLNVIDDGDGTVTIDPAHNHDSRYVNEDDHDKAAHDALNIDADTIDGNHASAFASSGHNHDSRYVNKSGDTMSGSLTLNNGRLDAGGTDGIVHPFYSSLGNVPTNLPEGTTVYVSGDGLYVEDGT